MNRRLVVAGFAAAVSLTALVGAHTAQAEPRGAACGLSGAATISPGLSTTAKSQKITLSNVKLANCQGGSSASPGAPKKLTGTVTTSPNPTVIKASCASGNLKLTATIKWSTGKTTTATIKTTGLTANQYINGKVTSSTDPYIQSGALVQGDVAFRPNNPAQTCSKGITAVTFNGIIGIGSPR